MLARYAEARAKERSGYDADEDTDDDVVELNGPPRDESVRVKTILLSELLMTFKAPLNVAACCDQLRTFDQ